MDATNLIIFSSRQVHMITSEKSYNDKVNRFQMRMSQAIPIKRPMDYRYPGSGQIKITQNLITGLNTQFLNETKPEDYLVIKGEEFKILQILNNTEIVTKSDKTTEIFHNFKVYPKVNNSQCYDTVMAKLQKNIAVGIFPEGETHETPNLIPLKAGFAALIIKALQQNIPVAVQCFTYSISSPYKYTAKVQLVLGRKIEFESEILNMEKEKMYETIFGRIKKVIDKKGLEEIMVPVETFEEHSVLYFIAKLKFNEELVYDQSATLIRVFNSLKAATDNYSKFVSDLYEEIQEYKDKCRSLGISKFRKDYTISKSEYDLNLWILILMAVFFSAGYSIVFILWGIIEILVSRQKALTIKALEYRKTTADCLMTWRASYIVLFSVLGMALSNTLCFLSTFSITSTLICSLLLPVYFTFCFLSIRPFRRGIKVLRLYRLKDPSPLSKILTSRSSILSKLNS